MLIYVAQIKSIECYGNQISNKKTVHLSQNCFSRTRTANWPVLEKINGLRIASIGDVSISCSFAVRGVHLTNYVPRR